MKTAILVLTIVGIFLTIVSRCFTNYIKNDKMERIKYIYSEGMSNSGIWLAIILTLRTLVFTADSILILLLFLSKI